VKKREKILFNIRGLYDYLRSTVNEEVSSIDILAIEKINKWQLYCLFSQHIYIYIIIIIKFHNVYPYMINHLPDLCEFYVFIIVIFIVIKKKRSGCPICIDRDRYKGGSGAGVTVTAGDNSITRLEEEKRGS